MSLKVKFLLFLLIYLLISIVLVMNRQSFVIGLLMLILSLPMAYVYRIVVDYQNAKAIRKHMQNIDEINEKLEEINKKLQ